MRRIRSRSGTDEKAPAILQKGKLHSEIHHGIFEDQYPLLRVDMIAACQSKIIL